MMRIDAINPGDKEEADLVKMISAGERTGQRGSWLCHQPVVDKASCLASPNAVVVVYSPDLFPSAE